MDIKQQSAEELKRLLHEQRAQLIEFRFQAHAGALKQVHRIREARTTVARIMKRLHELAHEPSSASSTKKSTS